MRASNNPVQEINWEPIASRGCPIRSDTRAREEQGLWHSRWQAVVRLVPKSTYSTYRCSSSSHHCVHGSGRDGQGIRREGADSAARSETDSREPAIAHYRDPDRVDYEWSAAGAKDQPRECAMGRPGDAAGGNLFETGRESCLCARRC